MADKRPLIVLSETQCFKYLNKWGFNPSKFFTDLKIFNENSPFFENALVLILVVGNSYFRRSELYNTYKDLSERAKDKADNTISDVIVLSNVLLTTFEDYLLYEDTIFSSRRCRYSKIEPKVYSLYDILEYTSETLDVELYMKDADYGFDYTALQNVRATVGKDKLEDDIRKLIKIPELK